MKRKSIDISHLTPLHWTIWGVAAIIIIGSIYVFFQSFDHWIVINGQFGDLLAGTVGVGASIGAMLFIIVTLVEQRKMNKLIEVHHLVENFNSLFDRFILLQKDVSESEAGKEIKVKKSLEFDRFILTPEDVSVYELDREIKVKKHLEYLWSEDIQTALNLLTNKLREKTIVDIATLRKLCQDEDLTRVSRTLNRLLSIKYKIAEFDSDAVKRVDDDWESISPIWKEYAGFYFGWQSSTNTKTREEVLSNEMTKYFYEHNDEKLPEFIPQIKVKKQEDIFKLNIDEFAKQSVRIESNSAFEVKIVKLNLSGYHFTAPDLSIDVNNVVLAPQSSSTFSFKELFGSQIQAAFQHIKGAPSIDENKTKNVLYHELVLEYLGKKWFYENQIELNFYPNNHASVLYHEIKEQKN